MGYTKLFSTIVTSSIWTEPDSVRLVWITMLALADKNGEVQASIPGLARVAGVPIAAAEEAISRFLAPDPYSRTKDDEGRRVEPIDGGWLLLNHAKYRRMASKDEAKEKNAIRQQRHRDRQKSNGDVTQSNAPVTENNGKITHQRDIAEAEAEAEAKKQHPPASRGDAWPTLEEVLACGQAVMADTECCTKFFNELEAVGWVNKHGHPVKDWRPLLRNYATSWKSNAFQRRDGKGTNHAPNSTLRRSCL